MQINLDEYNSKDKSLIIDHTEEILKYGLQVYKKHHHIELTAAEKLLYDIFVENSYRCLSKETVASLYNERLYKDRVDKYIQPSNIITKINRMNKKIKDTKIKNKYGCGYYLIKLKEE